MITLGLVLAGCIAALLLVCCLGALIEALAQALPLVLLLCLAWWLLH